MKLKSKKKWNLELMIKLIKLIQIKTKLILKKMKIINKNKFKKKY